MQAGFFEMLEGCIGGLDKILPCFFTLHLLKNRFFHKVMWGTLFYARQGSYAITVG